MNNQIEQKLDSREVSEMIEMRHPELLRKIEGINKDFRERKIAFSKYWEESSYKVDGNNRTYKNFLITKRGCEFLAHKTTGTKGNLFTDRYMDRFEQMKQQLINPIENLDLANQMMNIMQNTQMMAQVVQGLNQGMGYIQQYVQDSIQAKDHQIDKAMSLIGLRSKNVSSLISKLKEEFYKRNGEMVQANDIEYLKAKNKIFKEFKVTKWEEIPIGKYNAVHSFIEVMFDFD